MLRVAVSPLGGAPDARVWPPPPPVPSRWRPLWRPLWPAAPVGGPTVPLVLPRQWKCYYFSIPSNPAWWLLAPPGGGLAPTCRAVWSVIAAFPLFRPGLKNRIVLLGLQWGVNWKTNHITSLFCVFLGFILIVSSLLLFTSCFRFLGGN